jgi:hypothetical protein
MFFVELPIDQNGNKISIIILFFSSGKKIIDIVEYIITSVNSIKIQHFSQDYFSSNKNSYY